MITITDWAYLAALVDGEGSILLKREGKRYCRIPTVAIISTTPELVDWLPAKFGGSMSKSKMLERPRAEYAYVWSIQGQAAISTMRAMCGFMHSINKKARIELILTEWVLVNKNSPDEMKDKAAKLELTFFRMWGHKGKKLKYTRVCVDYLKKHPEDAIDNYEADKGFIL